MVMAIKMKALTIYQPYASLIILGAKPYEFRGHDYRKRDRSIEGARIVIHAAARAIVPGEISDLMYRVCYESTSLDKDKTLALCNRLCAAHQCLGVIEMSAGLGTAVLGKPVRVAELFAGTADSDRLDHSKWAWPLTDVRPFKAPIPCRGFQGFWSWPFAEAA